MRVMMLVDIISIPVTSLPPPYAMRLSAISSRWSLLWTVLNSTTPFTSKHTAQPWERQTHFHMRRTIHTPCCASSTTFSWSDLRKRIMHFYYFPQHHSPHYQIHFIPFSQQHLLLFSTSRSHLTRPISILNRQTNTNTFHNNRVTLYIRNEPFHSASLSDYDAYALRRKLRITRQWTHQIP